jgi:hypothetical protein
MNASAKNEQKNHHNWQDILGTSFKGVEHSLHLFLQFLIKTPMKKIIARLGIAIFACCKR